MNTEPPGENKPCILLVDDKPQNLLAMRRLLESPDFGIMTAISGNDALALALEHDFAVILLDVQMPQMDGFETARLLRMDEATRDVPIIFVTAQFKDRRNVNKGYAYGAVDYLFKPINPEILKSKINVFLALNRQKAALHRVNMELTRANKAKGEFLARMSDEICTPIQGMLGLAGMLMEENLSPDQQQVVGIMRTNARNLQKIVGDILDFSRIETGRSGLNSVAFDLRAILRDVEYVLGLRAKEKNLEFACEMEPGMPVMLIGDPARLRQIILNMVSNAVKFTRQGKVAVHAALAQDLGGRAVLRFTVTDTGIGIPPQWQGSVFEAFAQMRLTPGDAPGGTGLGLAIAGKLVDLMGGATGVESTEGMGSQFWFTVNLEKQPEEGAQEKKDCGMKPNPEHGAAQEFLKPLPWRPSVQEECLEAAPGEVSCREGAGSLSAL